MKRAGNDPCVRPNAGNNKILKFLKGKKDSPEEVVSAEEFPLSGEALVCEVGMAVEAADALGRPGTVQHVEKELVQDGFFTSSANDDHCVRIDKTTCSPTWKITEPS